MADDKISILLSDVSIQGDLVEKEKIILDAKVTGDITADEIVTHNLSNISGNIKAKKFTHLFLSNQFSGLKLPDIELIDMKNEKLRFGRKNKL